MISDYIIAALVCPPITMQRFVFKHRRKYCHVTSCDIM